MIRIIEASFLLIVKVDSDDFIVLMIESKAICLVCVIQEFAPFWGQYLGKLYSFNIKVLFRNGMVILTRYFNSSKCLGFCNAQILFTFFEVLSSEAHFFLCVKY